MRRRKCNICAAELRGSAASTPPKSAAGLLVSNAVHIRHPRALEPRAARLQQRPSANGDSDAPGESRTRDLRAGSAALSPTTWPGPGREAARLFRIHPSVLRVGPVGGWRAGREGQTGDGNRGQGRAGGRAERGGEGERQRQIAWLSEPGGVEGCLHAIRVTLPGVVRYAARPAWPVKATTGRIRRSTTHSVDRPPEPRITWTGRLGPRHLARTRMGRGE